MHLKLVLAFALVAACSASYLGYNNYIVNVFENEIVVIGKEDRKIDLVTNYNQGQQSVYVVVNGPDVPLQTAQVGGVQQGQILYQIFQQYSGQLNQQIVQELLGVISKYVQLGEVNPVVLYALQYVFYGDVQALYLVGNYLSQGGILGQTNYYNQLGIFGQSFNKYYGQNYNNYLSNYGGLNNIIGGYQGSYLKQYPSSIGGLYNQGYGYNQGNGYNQGYGVPSVYQSGGYYGPYASSVYQKSYGILGGSQYPYGIGYQNSNYVNQYRGVNPSVYQWLQNTGVQGQYSGYPSYLAYNSLYY